MKKDNFHLSFSSNSSFFCLLFDMFKNDFRITVYNKFYGDFEILKYQLIIWKLFDICQLELFNYSFIIFLLQLICLPIPSIFFLFRQTV